MSPKAHWQQQVNEGLLSLDAEQQPIIEALDDLFKALMAEPLEQPKKTLWPFGRKGKKVINTPKGLYIWGSVGRGKSMLMDLFAEKIKEKGTQTILRQHFHEFMRHIQKQLRDNREAYKAFDNPLTPLAAEIASQSRILCFDEFQITNIADAMILGRLFEGLFAHGVTVIATSNIAPDDLYKDGLHRSRFLPFIEILKNHMHVFQMGGTEDFRQRGDIAEDAWLYPLSEENEAKFHQLFYAQAQSHGKIDRQLNIDGRILPLIKAEDQIAMVDYEALCREPRGTADYIALAENFHSVYLLNIPRLTKEGAAARRFIHLIDILYEKRIRLYMLADCKTEDLAPPASDATAFLRTLSRLTEMRSQEWQAHSIEAWSKL